MNELASLNQIVSEIKFFENQGIQWEKGRNMNKFYYIVTIKIKKYENRFVSNRKTMYLIDLQGSMSKSIEDAILFSNIDVAENIAGKIEKSIEEHSDYICACNVEKIDIDEAFNLNMI